MEVAMHVLAKHKCYEDFSNAKQAKSLVSEALMNYLARQRQPSLSQIKRFSGVLLPEDFDPQLRPSTIASKATPTCRGILSPLGVSMLVIGQLEKLFPWGWAPRSENCYPLYGVPRALVLKGPLGECSG
ncbi:hypothetical protein B0T14DRAFT_519909, partial [Immersiella caudata]